MVFTLNQKLLLCLLIGLWCIGYILNTVIVKRMAITTFYDLKWIELTALQHLIGLILSATPLAIKRRSFWTSSPTFHEKLILCAAALLNVLGNLATNYILYEMDSSTTSDSIEASQPLFTLVLIYVSSRMNSVNYISDSLSMLLIVFGVGTINTRSEVLSTWSLLSSLIVATALASRNVLLKKLSASECCSAHQQFVLLSLMSTVFVAPVWTIKLAITQTFSIWWWDPLSAVTHTLYSLSSIHLLHNIDIITHSIATVLIKVPTFVEMSNLKYLQNPLFSIIFSIFVIVFGVCFYHWDKIKPKLVFAVFVVAIWTYNTPSIPQYFSDIHLPTDLHLTPKCTIFTAWLYEKPLPDFAVTNIVALARQNPNMLVRVLCGSTQCVGVLERQRMPNMEIEFALINKIVEGVSPLQLWLARHPLNKLLAGREFEDHLQDVTILATLLKHGGFYADPTLTPKDSLSHEECLKDSSVWISEGSTLTKHHQPLLGVVFFPPNHSFVWELANLYASKYPRDKENADKLFQQDYLEIVWNMLLRNDWVCTICPAARFLNIASASQVPSLPSSHHFGVIRSSSQPLESDSSLDSVLWDFAWLQFLPVFDTFIDSSKQEVDKSTTVLYNGWGGTALPHNVDLIPISVYLERNAIISTELMKYLKLKEPIGCRDSDTLDYLTKRNISAFLSGNSMLLVGGADTSATHRHGIYTTELNDEAFQLLPSQIQEAAIQSDREVITLLKSVNDISKLDGMYRLLEEYKSAELVITLCVQCALACVALGTPVIFINTNSNQFSHSTGTPSLFHTLDLSILSTDQARDWLSKFAWDAIPPNPNAGEMMRLRASAWNVLRQNQALHDAARKFGLIPMSLPRLFPSERKILFHMIFTSSGKDTIPTFGSSEKQSGAFNWRHMRSVESIFRYHPTSDLIIHSNTLPQSTFNALTEAGYSVRVEPYDLNEILKGTPADKFIPRLRKASKGTYWVYNEGNLLRLIAVYKWGGVYMDTDIILVRPLTSLQINGVCRENALNINNAFFMFERAHLFLKQLLMTFVREYNGEVWGHNGPYLVKKVWKHWKENKVKAEVEIYKHTVMYMFHHSVIKKACFDVTSGATFDNYKRILHTEAYGVHVNAKVTGYIGLSDGKLKRGTLCSELFNSHCVLCDRTY